MNMDPDKLLEAMRDLSFRILSTDDSDTDTITDLGLELADCFAALDEWILRGGFLPKDWIKM